MGKRNLDVVLRKLISKLGFDNITFVGPNERSWLIRQIEGLGVEIDVVDSDPKFDNPRDAIFDNIEFKDLVVVFNAEKHYPIGKIHKGNFIIVGDDENHNGDCNPISNCETLIEQNDIKDWWFQYGVEDENKKWYIVGGTNAN